MFQGHAWTRPLALAVQTSGLGVLRIRRGCQPESECGDRSTFIFNLELVCISRLILSGSSLNKEH